MTGFFAILSILSVFGIILGLIKPSWVLRWGAKRTRLRAVGWYWLFTIVFAIAAGATAPKINKADQDGAPQERTTTSKATSQKGQRNKNSGTKIDDETIHINVGDNQTKQPQRVELPKKTKDKPITKNIQFDFSLRTFIKRFNTSAKNLKQATIHKATVADKDDNSGKVYTLVSSNKNIGFIVTTSNSGIVREATMIGSGDGTPASGVRVIMGMASYFDVFDPKITASGRGKILKKLGITSGSIPDKSTCTQKNVKYTLFNTKGVGLWLIAEPAR